MKWVKEVKVNKMQPKPTVKYPIIRLPSQYADLIGKKVQLFETEVNGCLAFTIVVSDGREVMKTDSITHDMEAMEKRISELERKYEELYDAVFGESKHENALNREIICRGGDSNPRPPDYESGAPTS